MEDKFLRKLDLLLRMLKYSKKQFIFTYIESQKKVLEKILRGRPYILCTYYFPSEIASAVDVEFLYVERIVGLAVGSRMIEDEKMRGIGENNCSYQNAFLYLIQNKIIPLPEKLIAVRYPCNDAVLLCDYLHETYNIPIFYIDRANIGGCLQNLYCKLTKEYGLREELSKVVSLSIQASDLKKRIDRYRIRYPGIVASDDCLKVFTVENDFGSETAVAVLEQMKVYIESKIEKYVSTKNKKIFWMGLIPLYNNSILSLTEQNTNCTFVFEEMWLFGGYELAEEHFFSDLAGRIEQNLFYNTRRRANRLVKKIKEVNAELVINCSHNTCSFLPRTLHQIEEIFQENNLNIHTIYGNVVINQYDNKIWMNEIMQYIDRNRNQHGN